MFKSKLLISEIYPVKHLYIHVPFCRRFCTYCDFPKIIFQADKHKKFIMRLNDELNYFSPLIKELETIYIGGGTPNACTHNELESLLMLISKHISRRSLKEYTIECNPSSWNKSHIKLFKKYGVNRLSLGIQSTNDQINKSCNRIQSIKQVENAYRDIRENGNFKISFDFILNFFNQTKKDIYQDLEFIKNHMPDHISWYSLMLKQNTVLASLHKNLLNNDDTYSKIVKNELSQIGFEQYEISNYAIKGFESIHNMCYWTSKTFLGVGWGASSLLKYKNSNTFFRRRYTGTFEVPKEQIIILTERIYHFQVLLMGLRLLNGININIEPFRTSYLLFKDKITEEIKLLNLEIRDDHLRCTIKGRDFLDSILLNIMD